ITIKQAIALTPSSEAIAPLGLVSSSCFANQAVSVCRLPNQGNRRLRLLLIFSCWRALSFIGEALLVFALIGLSIVDCFMKVVISFQHRAYVGELPSGRPNHFCVTAQTSPGVGTCNLFTFMLISLEGLAGRRICRLRTVFPAISKFPG